MLRVNEGEVRVAIEARYADSGLFRRGLHGVQVLVRPVPEPNELEAVVLRRLKPLQEGELAVHGLDAGRFFAKPCFILFMLFALCYAHISVKHTIALPVLLSTRNRKTF